LLLDEPFSHLDAENVERAAALISEVCATQGAGCVLTSLGYDYPLAYDKTLIL
jgi:putative ABC transport system ATP-binding protein